MRKKGLLITLLIVLISLMPMAGQAQDDVSVSVMANWGGVEQVGFEAVLAAFTEATGIATEYIGDRNAEVTVQAMIAAGNPPDIQSMPRPGVVAEFARDGVLQALTSGDDPIIPLETLQANYAQGIIDQGLVDGEIYGILHAPIPRAQFGIAPIPSPISIWKPRPPGMNSWNWSISWAKRASRRCRWAALTAGR